MCKHKLCWKLQSPTTVQTLASQPRPRPAPPRPRSRVLFLAGWVGEGDGWRGGRPRPRFPPLRTADATAVEGPASGAVDGPATGESALSVGRGHSTSFHSSFTKGRMWVWRYCCRSWLKPGGSMATGGVDGSEVSLSPISLNCSSGLSWAAFMKTTPGLAASNLWTI